MTTPISLTQQAAVEYAINRCFDVSGVQQSLREVLDILRSLAEPPSDEEVQTVIYTLKEQWPRAALTVERLVRQLAEEHDTCERALNDWNRAMDELAEARAREAALEQQLAAAQARIPREPTPAMVAAAMNYLPGKFGILQWKHIWRDMYDAAQSQESGSRENG